MLWKSVFGNRKDFSFENIIFNAIYFVILVESFVSIFWNIIIHTPVPVLAIQVVMFVLVAYLYFQSRFRKKFSSLFLTLLFAVLLSVVWVFNEGSSGSTTYIYITAMVCSVAVSKKKWHFVYLAIYIANISLLYVAESLWPELLTMNPHDSEHIQAEMTMFFILNLVLIFFMVSFLKKNYDQENNTINEQKEKIGLINKKMVDSITSAKFIQDALLPNHTVMKECLPQHFVLFKPRDIVSGDFYWVKQNGSQISIAAADCTGHGVPGAFMSILGISMLDVVTLEAPNDNAAGILDRLRDKVKSALDNTEAVHTISYGMDITYCQIDNKNYTLHFAGAHNPLILIREGELQQIKADRMPIANYPREAPFTNHKIEIKSGDMLYMFSDGIPDQMGGQKKSKLKRKILLDKLEQICDKPLDEQQQSLDEMILNWQGENEQTDDILIIGVRIA